MTCATPTDGHRDIRQVHGPLTDHAHEAVARVLRRGDLAVDATVGNGFDTAFLGATVGPAGHVIGLDIQPLAIQRTQLLLGQAGLLARTTLLQCGHERLATAVPQAWKGRVRAVMLNLGYLPRGDRTLTTQPATTLAALRDAVTVLGTPGVLTVLAYRGHPGGAGEATAVEDWAAEIAAHGFSVTTLTSADAGATSPVLHVVERC